MPNNKVSFEEIYKNHHTMVSQMCLGFVKGNSELANDLSQEVFIIIWNKLSNFKVKSSLKTWIYRITVNTCLQHLRKASKHTIYSLSTNEESKVEATDAESTDNTPALYKAIGELRKMDRLLIMMVLDDQNNDTIANVLGIKPSSIRVKIHRIKNRLKKILTNGKWFRRYKKALG